MAMENGPCWGCIPYRGFSIAMLLYWRVYSYSQDSSALAFLGVFCSLVIAFSVFSSPLSQPRVQQKTVMVIMVRKQVYAKSYMFTMCDSRPCCNQLQACSVRSFATSVKVTQKTSGPPLVTFGLCRIAKDRVSNLQMIRKGTVSSHKYRTNTKRSSPYDLPSNIKSHGRNPAPVTSIQYNIFQSYNYAQAFHTSHDLPENPSIISDGWTVRPSHGWHLENYTSNRSNAEFKATKQNNGLTWIFHSHQFLISFLVIFGAC